MKSLTYDRLKDFERDPLNNFLTRSEMMEVVRENIAIREAQCKPVGDIVAWSGADREKGITRDVDFRFLRFDVQPGQQLFTAAQAQNPVVFPDINEDLVEILGRPNFTCSGIAELFRGNGADIKRKSENEQAFIIHWLIGVYLTHGSDWRLVAEAELKVIADKIKAAGCIVSDK